MDIDTHAELETKAGLPPEAGLMQADMLRAFEAYKETSGSTAPTSSRASTPRSTHISGTSTLRSTRRSAGSTNSR